MRAKNEYWISPAGQKSFAVWKKNYMGAISRIGTFRSYKKAEAVRSSLVNPTPHIVP